MLSNTLVGEFGMGFQRLFTYDLLDPELMWQYGFNITTNQRRVAKATERAIKKTLPHLPSIIRYNAQYLEAEKKLIHLNFS